MASRLRSSIRTWRSRWQTWLHGRTQSGTCGKVRILKVLCVPVRQKSSSSWTAPGTAACVPRSRTRSARRSDRAGSIAGTLLPSTRALAVDLGVTRGVVVAAYDQLLAEGYLAARAGSSTIVNATTARRHAATADRRAAQSAGRRLPAGTSRSSTCSPDRHGCERRARPASDAEQRSRLHRSTRTRFSFAMRWPTTSAAFEASTPTPIRWSSATVSPTASASPYAPFATSATRSSPSRTRDTTTPAANWTRLGVRARAVDVDEQGIVVDQLRRARCRAVVVTPAHHSPTGVVLSAARRSGLVAWAHDADGYIIEDDYDAEFRYDRHPVGALQGVAPDRVIYSGTASKSLSPGSAAGLARRTAAPGRVDRRRTPTRRPCHLVDHSRRRSPRSSPTVTSTATYGARGASTGNAATP